MPRKGTLLAMVAALVALMATTVTTGAAGPPLRTYRVTIENLAGAQPLSPPVIATHRMAVGMFDVGRLASPQIEAIAEDGNEVPMFNLLSGSKHVTQAVDVGRPLTPAGTVVGAFTDSVTFEISAKPGDRLSVATMLICTNDGFTGLDSVKLPKRGTAVYLSNAYDAGTENNTEQSEDIVDPCSALGPVVLTGDPNGNQDAAVDTMPQQPILHHAGIFGIGDLLLAHNWTNPVAMVTVELID